MGFSARSWNSWVLRRAGISRLRAAPGDVEDLGDLLGCQVFRDGEAQHLGVGGVELGEDGLDLHHSVGRSTGSRSSVSASRSRLLRAWLRCSCSTTSQATAYSQVTGSGRPPTSAATRRRTLPRRWRRRHRVRRVGWHRPRGPGSGRRRALRASVCPEAGTRCPYPFIPGCRRIVTCLGKVWRGMVGGRVQEASTRSRLVPRRLLLDRERPDSTRGSGGAAVARPSALGLEQSGP